MLVQLATCWDPITLEDEAIVSIVAKGRVDQLRRARRIICAVEEHEENKGKANRVAALRQMKGRVEGSLAELLNQHIASIDNGFLSHPTSEVSRILFLKIKADYSRYLAEIQRMQPAQVQAASVTAYDAARIVRTRCGPGSPSTTPSCTTRYSEAAKRPSRSQRAQTTRE
jgi:14-3-3 protein epsilon